MAEEKSKSSSLFFERPDKANKCEWNPKNADKSPHQHIEPPTKHKIFSNILEATGQTPMVKLNKIPKEYGVKCKVVAKCDFFNPGGSVKDRIGYRMIEEAENQNKIKPGDTIIEATSGNTGIAVALACAVKGYKCVIVMPEKTSAEKELVIRALGAEVVRTPDNVQYDSLEAPVPVAYKIQSTRPDSFVLNQYTNTYNPISHYDITAEEIIDQCDGSIAMIVLGVGTGGTITGIGRKFKEKFPKCKIVGVEPVGSVFSGQSKLLETPDGKPISFEIEGIGYDFIPTVLDRNVVDRWIQVDDKNSFVMARKLIKDEGLLCGGSSGTVVAAAMQAAGDLNKKQTCVVLLGDGIRNYMTKYLTDTWMYERGYMNIDNKMKEIFWWWHYRVKDIKTREAPLISVDESFENIVAFIQKTGYQTLIATEEKDKKIIIKGNISSESIMQKLSQGLDLTKCNGRHFLKEYKKITLNDSLARLYSLLAENRYVVVFHSLSVEEASTVDFNSIDRLTGIITRVEFFKFISEKKQEHDNLHLTEEK